MKEEFGATHTVLLPSPVMSFHLSKLHTSLACYLEVNSTVEFYLDHKDMKHHHIEKGKKLRDIMPNQQL